MRDVAGLPRCIVCPEARTVIVSSVFAPEHFKLRAWSQSKILQKVEEAFILLIDAQNFRGVVGAQF
jgi:hypothetical protein